LKEQRQKKIVKPIKQKAFLTRLSLLSFLHYAVQFVKPFRACVRIVAKVRLFSRLFLSNVKISKIFIHLKKRKMEKKKLYCGVDISGNTIDVCIQKEDNTFESLTYSNDKIGFKALLQVANKTHHFVMESTGVYHMALCFYLHERKRHYSVVNALKIKRYIQMNLERNKSDKKDAKYICKYGIDQAPEQYQMPDSLYFECRTLNNSILAFTQEITSLKNKIHSLDTLKIDCKSVKKGYEDGIQFFEKQKEKWELELVDKLNEWQPDLVKLVSSITGIGKRATSLLIVSTQGFKTTETYQQLISYAGLSPKEYSSGSSIRGKVRICKMGGSHLRNTLYMCALNAKKTNPACKTLYDRLVAKGKNKKLAIIAVCNKLLKQVFGVVKSGVVFDKNYLVKIA
jgi:transposase